MPVVKTGPEKGKQDIMLILAFVFFILWLIAKKKHKKAAADAEAKAAELQQAIDDAVKAANLKAEQDAAKFAEAQAQIDVLKKYEPIVDAEAEAKRIIDAAQDEASEIRYDAKNYADELKQKTTAANVAARLKSETAEQEAAKIIADARRKAEEIAGEALDAKSNATIYTDAATAMKNVINGYGDEWLKPTYSLLDELADELGHTEAGQKLKEARATSARMIKSKTAAECDYIEVQRKETAINFVIDAFNGKVDSILSKSKKDNYGKLEQQIKDAYSLVNLNGRAFKNARITPEYLAARIDELHWAVIVHELRSREIEEQREIREQMREEEKARREFEKAQREAAKEEEMLKKAMAKAQDMLSKASEEQKAKYEAQLSELSDKLHEAEEKSQRAISMAQQTKRGNVYVISNIGSFGENVYKVGMTRRLDPLDRVKELGDASVPFRFDVHAIIESDDAPALEHMLHQELALMQMNKVNPKKEFFRVALADIRSLVEKHGIAANWTMAAEAAEYRESLAIEERMKSDPDVRQKWIEYQNNVRIALDDDDEATA